MSNSTSATTSTGGFWDVAPTVTNSPIWHTGTATYPPNTWPTYSPTISGPFLPADALAVIPVQNGYKITFKGKEWVAHNADELTDLIKEILVTDKLTESLTATP